jgi:glycosyltransferase involved in cell wall biosynthesis
MSSKLRVAVIGQLPPLKGGIAHYNANLIRELEGGADVLPISFVRIFPRWLHPLKMNRSSEHTQLFRTDPEPIFDVPRFSSWKRVVRRVAEFRPGVLIFHWYTPILAVPFSYVLRGVRRLVPGIRIVCVAHNVVPHERTPFDKALTKLAFKYVDIVVVHSERDLKVAEAWFPRQQIEQLFHPVYDFFGSNLNREAARAKLGFARPTLLFFGGIRRYKGLEYLLESLLLVLRRVPVELVIAGEFFGNRGRYARLIEKLGIGNQIQLLDRYVQDEEVGVLFRAADLVVAPYVSGTQSGALSIAVAFGVPVVATDVGGFGEIVRTGETGYLVPPRDPQAFAEAIIDFFERNRSREFRAAMEKLRGERSWQSFAKRLLALLSLSSNQE